MTGWKLDESFESSSGRVRWDRLGSGEPIVLCHGTPFSSYVWRAVARALAQTHEVYVWDMPGYGTSEQFEGQDVSLAAQGRVFTELLAHWGLNRPTVFAHDFGGAVSLRAHLLHGVPYRRLALVDVVALRPWGSPSFRHLGEHAEVFAALPEGLHRALVEEYVSSVSPRGLHPEVLREVVAPWTGETGQAAFYRQIAQATPRDTDEFHDRLGTIEVPVLVCWGTEDSWIPAAKAHELGALIPGARVRLIEGAGHLVQEDAPAELTAALAAFARS
ncbi:alpha/beta fold hydrolase [Nocardiopsis aegyptia]|uniref:Pimeloyl-ACP methyl ester carboxylesterase n=1 Tax=Nocardiopsis aegyptia TaxID=220378 RepID=A0A7Z0JAJ2_9ACTN|nr:alpha/beta hydrolase [Nocardiopsis aegyptia]NYJ34832.1 pimeloyl-ACP methyl ester carboxylesterase [Nocardiopsis aegyptia]